MKNTLVQYKGGGYEGCFWEWNFAFYDENGKFNSIMHSGRNGCETHEAMQEHIRENEVYTYDLTSREDMRDFASECNIGHIKGVFEYMARNEHYDYELF